MFTYKLCKPNKFVFKPIHSNLDYFVIPFGHRCTSALACRYARLRQFSLPFDWTNPSSPDKIKKVLEEDFADFIPDVHNKKFKNKYEIKLEHFNHNIDKGINEYKRRIIRFNELLNNKQKKYFIYINEDYLYDSKYRQDKFLDNNFSHMLDLETFIREKYTGIDYNILFFDFKKHTIPKDSNIITIVLSTTNTYTSVDKCNKVYEPFRNYCGKILAELFNTKLTLDTKKNFD